MEKFYIENKSQTDITKELKNDFKNYESNKKDYNEELHDLGKTHLMQYKSKIDNAIKKIENTQSIDNRKFSEQYSKLRNKLSKAQQEIYNQTIKLDLGYIAYKRHHDEHLNAIGATIDHYENDAITTINELIDAINDDEQIQGEKTNIDDANKKRKYIEIDDNGIYRLTKNTNKPKIHEVLGTVIKEGELWKIDYSLCTNQSIRSKMASAISSNSKYEQASSSRLSCYLQYDSQKKTYFISDGQGNILPQRALIWEGVQLTPPSKIKGEAKIAETKQQNAMIQEVNRTNLTVNEKQQLKDSMPQKLRNAIPNEYFDEFFSKTEEDINDRIKNAKHLGYELASQPVSKVGHTKNGRMLEIHLINGQAETKEDLITSQLSEPLFKILDSKETELVQYITSRIITKWGNFDYLTKKDTVINHKEANKSGKISEEQKEFTTYGLGLLSQRADNVFDKIGNTSNANDRKFASLKKYIQDSLYTLENTDNISQNDLKDIQKKLCELIPTKINNINNLVANILGTNTNWSKLEDYKDENTRVQEYQKLKDSAKATAIDSIRKIGNDRTIFNNAETSFLRDEIINDVTDENIDMENDNYEKYFKKIYELYSLPEPNLTEGEDFDPNKIIGSKKSEIDELYKNAHGDKDEFLQFLINKGLLPPKANENKIKEKVKELKTSLNQQEQAAKNFKITGTELRNRFKSEQTDLQLKSNLTTQEKQRLNEIDFLLAQENSFFDDIANDETEKTKDTIKYVGIESTIKSKIAPYLIQKGGGIKGVDNSKIYNDSVGAGGLFERSDENCSKIGPVLKEIIIEVVITAVSIALSWNGAGEAIYGAFRAAKLVAQTAKGIQKVLKFMAAFSKALAKRMAAQYASKFAARSAQATKAISSASKIVKGGETFGSLTTKLAMKGASMVIEGTTFHISNTIIHNAINGNRLSEGLNPNGYTEGPDGEKIQNRKSYAQSIAFLGVLKIISKPIQSLSGNLAKSILKTRYPTNVAQKMLSNILSMTGEMGSMMGTDQILSLSFDQKFKSITAEDLITMFGMVAGLRLTNKVNMKIQQYDKKSVTIEMRQGENTFNVKLDRDGNVLKIDGKDNTGKKISNPESKLGIKSRDGQNAQNLRQAQINKEIGNIKGDIRQLDNLHEGDIITIKHGENDIQFKKNKDGNRQITDAGNITNERFNVGEEFVIKDNPDGSGYHLESKNGGRVKISLAGKVGVKLGTSAIDYNDYIKLNIPNQLDEYLGNFIKNNGKKLNFKEFIESPLKASQFIDGVHERFKKITLNSGIKIPKDFIKNLGETIKEIAKKRGNKLSEYHNNLTKKFSKLLEKKLSESGNIVEIKKEDVNMLINEGENETWIKQQNQYKSEIVNAQKKLLELPENLRSDAMKKLLEIKNIEQLSQKEIKQIQKEIGLKPNEISGIFEGRSLKKLEEYINYQNILRSDSFVSEQWDTLHTIQEKRDFLREKLGINGLTNTDIQSLNKEQISIIKQIIDLGFPKEFLIRDMVIIWSNYTQKQVNTLKILHKMGVDVSQFPGKLSKFTPVQIETLKVFKELGIEINRTICDYVKDITPDEMEILVQDNPNYEGYNYRTEELNAYHNYKRGRIIEKIQQYIQNTINENRNILNKEVIDKIRTDLITLPAKERIDIIKTITNVISKVNTINHYLDFKNGPYKTPKELLCAMRGISNPSIISQITNDITVIKHGSGMHFFVGDERSYQIIHDCGLKDSGERSGGFNCTRSKIKQLEGTLSVSNGKNPGTDWNRYEYGTIWHEGQHNWNSYFMSDKTSNRPAIVRAKDEITAYLRDGRGIFKKEKWGGTIEQILTEGKSEGGLYTYGLEGKAWEAHKAHVRELLRYANDLVELSKNPKTGLTKDKIISMLSDVPEAGWKDLHANITKAVNLHLNRNASQREIMSLRENFISKIKERASNNKLITDLINWWNSLFPNHNINLEEFRWAGTTELKTVIENIGQCKSIDKIKHVLEDPKYSHISRGPNNKGGIEISAMIDEVIAGRLPITYIPVEIRPQIQKFIS